MLTVPLLVIISLWFLSAGSPAQAGAPASPSSSGPQTADAFAHWVYNGSSPTVITITMGTPVPLDLFINAGSNQDATAQQSYVTFSYNLFKFVDSAQGCTPSATVSPDTSTFDVTLQNEVCNGPAPCTFRGQPVDPGSFAFASGALSNPNCQNGCGGDFPVAHAAICGVATGQGTLHWQFDPPDPPTRDSQIISYDNQLLQNRNLYHDVTVIVVPCAGCATSTPAPSASPTGTPTRTATRTPTRTATAVATTTGTVTVVSTVTPVSSATPCTISFSDVHGTDYFYEPVRYLYCAGAISGYADGTFRPYNNTTRGQLSKIIVLAQGWPIDTTGGPHFSDVAPGSTFYSYVETAYNHGIISGYSDGTFQPGNNVTRGQLSKIVVLAMGWPLVTATTPTFSDVPAGSPFFAYVETAYCHQIISGYADGTFRPGNNATRGQISKIVYLAETGSAACGSR
jgi:hypothetical protein